MVQKRSLFRYYAERKWADALVDGRMRFWSLSYFRDLEDNGVRGDANEGKGIFAPEGGLGITNHTQGRRFTMPAHALTSRAVCDHIFVFCVSRTLSSRLWAEFGTSVCIEITNVRAFCARVAAALPEGATFPGRPGRERLGRRVEYYRTSDAADTLWALPDRIASSKLSGYAWQHEFRLIFGTTARWTFRTYRSRSSHVTLLRYQLRGPTASGHCGNEPARHLPHSCRSPERGVNGAVGATAMSHCRSSRLDRLRPGQAPALSSDERIDYFEKRARLAATNPPRRILSTEIMPVAVMA